MTSVLSSALEIVDRPEAQVGMECSHAVSKSEKLNLNPEVFYQHYLSNGPGLTLAAWRSSQPKSADEVMITAVTYRRRESRFT